MTRTTGLLKQPLLSFDELATRAWSRDVRALGGWKVRIANGFTLRANSVLPLTAVGHDVEHAIDEVEWQYASKGVVPAFQVASAAEHWDLAQRLTARGYRFAGHSEMWVGNVRSILEPIRRPIDATRPVLHLARADEHWIDSWMAIARHPEIHRPTATAIFAAAPATRRFAAMLAADGQIAGVAMGVVEEGTLGIFCVATDPALRRSGVARDVVRSLAGWAQDEGATVAYLQVAAGNGPARDLYHSLGFRFAYDYRYLSR